MGIGVHTALMNLHPVSGSIDDGFERGHKACLETIYLAEIFFLMLTINIQFCISVLFYITLYCIMQIPLYQCSPQDFLKGYWDYIILVPSFIITS